MAWQQNNYGSTVQEQERPVAPSHHESGTKRIRGFLDEFSLNQLIGVYCPIPVYMPTPARNNDLVFRKTEADMPWFFAGACIATFLVICGVRATQVRCFC